MKITKRIIVCFIAVIWFMTLMISLPVSLVYGYVKTGDGAEYTKECTWFQIIGFMTDWAER